MLNLLLTQNHTFIIGWVAKLLGFCMNGIFFVLDKIANLYGGTPNIGIAIIVFTIFVYLLLLPLTYKQQKFSKLSAIMNPELQAIQAKYKNSKDPQALQAMQEEQKAVYAKYGVSPTGSCLQLLIQMPILFALYRVIYAIPAYVPMVKAEYSELVNAMMGIDSATNLVGDADVFIKSAQFLQSGTQKGDPFFKTVMGFSKQFKPEYLNIQSINVENVKQNLMTVENIANVETTKNTFIDVLNRASSQDWTALQSFFNDHALVANTHAALERYNSFLGLNIGYSPLDTICTQLGVPDISFKTINLISFKDANIWVLIVAFLIPLLAALTQWIGVKLAPAAATTSDNDDNPMGQSMKMMNTIMPIMSAVFCFTLPAGLGLYWIAGAVIRAIEQVTINKIIDKQDINGKIEKNTAKYNEKLKKRGNFVNNLQQKAGTNAKFIPNPPKPVTNDKNANSKPVNNTSSGSGKGKSGGSLASKANMVKEFNERNNK